MMTVPHVCSLIAAPTVPGALQLLRIGATMAARPRINAIRINACMLLASTHLWLTQHQPHKLSQVLMTSFHISIYL